MSQGSNRENPDTQNELPSEFTQRELQEIQETRNQLRAALSHNDERITAAEDSLYFILHNFLSRGKDDPEMIDLLNGFLGELGNISGYGQSDRSLPLSARDEIKGVLTGATMALQMRRDRGAADKQPKEQVEHAHRFLELVQKRVGHIDQTNDEVQVRVKFRDDQASDKVTFRKGTPGA